MLETTITLEARKGVWTIVNRANPEERSIIDYNITTGNMGKNITEYIIDEEGHMRLKGKKEIDHNTITMTVKIHDEKVTTTRTRGMESIQ